jgi:acetaldehyde dehydrogenase (acetylating)
VKAELPKNGAYIVRGEDRAKLQAAMRDPKTGAVSGDVVGLSAEAIARRAGISVPAGTRVLVAECSEVGPKEFFSREKLSPVLGYFVDDGWERCCARAIQLLEYGGLGHSLAIHSKDEKVIQAFFEEKPAFRILLNTTSSLGAVGYTTGLVPAMTLGPGTWAGSSTSDNIGPLHLVNIKRLAGEVREFVAQKGAGSAVLGVGEQGPNTRHPAPSTQPSPLTPDEIAAIAEEFLKSYKATRRSA